MADFREREDVERWVEARPEATRRRDATILASRAALRVWPLLAGALGRRGEREFAESTLDVVRSNALARAAANYPVRAGELRVAAASAADASDAASAASAAVAAVVSDTAAASAASAADAASASAAYAAYATAAASAADAASAAAAYAADAYAAACTADAAASARKAIWRRLSADATDLETLGGAVMLSELPVWGEWRADASRGGRLELVGVPPEISRNWSRLKAELPKRAGENWQVWLDWYDGVLNGRPPWPALGEKQREDLTVAIALIDDKIWRQGPAVANAEVKRLIDEAHAKIEQPPEQEEEATPRIPPPKPAAIEPAWRRGQLIDPREAIAADLSPEDFLAALRAARADCVELVGDVRAEVAEAERLGRTPNLDMRPANHLERAASRIGDAPPSPLELFRFGHAAEALKHGLKSVEETWPDFLAARYGLLVAQLERAARQARAWRALLKNAADDAPPLEVVQAAPRYAIDFAEILREADAAGEPPLIAASIPDGLDALAGIAEERAEIARSPTPSIDAGAEALAVDLIDSVDNIVKKLAEAWLAIRPSAGLAANRAGGAIRDGWNEDLPKEGKRLGKLLAKIAVWGPIAGGATYLASQFEWFAPIAKLVTKMLTG